MTLNNNKQQQTHTEIRKISKLQLTGFKICKTKVCLYSI